MVAPTMSRGRRFAVLAVLCLPLLLVGMAMTILFLAIPDIARDLDADASDLQWAFAAYGIVFSGLVITGGALGDRYGRRRLLLLGLVIFGVASFAGAFVETAEGLVIARAVMGLGAALLMPGTLSIVTTVFTEPQERVQAIGIWSGVGGLGFILGPPIGGVLLSSFWWGSVMVANVPIVVVSFVLAVVLVPESRDPEHHRLDPVGAVLSIVAVSTAVFAFIESPERGWGSAPVLGALVVFAVATAAFVRWELRHEAPMLDVRLFRSALFTVPAVVITFGFFVAWGIQFLIPQYLQFLEGESVLTVGIVMAVISITWSISAPLIPRVVAKVGERRVMAAALLVTAAGVACFLAVDTGVTMVAVLVGLAAIGAGMGSTTTPATSMLVSSLPPEKAGVGSGMNDVTREAGAAFGVAVLGSVLAFRFTDRVEPALAGTRGQRARAVDGIHSAQLVARRLGGTKGARLRDAADAAFTSGFRLAVIVGVVVLVVVALLVLVKLPRHRNAPADAVR